MPSPGGRGDKEQRRARTEGLGPVLTRDREEEGHVPLRKDAREAGRSRTGNVWSTASHLGGEARDAPRGHVLKALIS